MPKWESKEVRPHGVWGSEIRLKSANTSRKGKVNKLLKLLREEVYETVL
uniref:Uncharacterized protein n=1 Tax=viral metagenome TaxID=1070528 RepID=A0A6M3J2P3_9ZZZZ